MKILFLTSRIPYPPYRGDKLKIYNLIRSLSKDNEIILLSFIENKAELEFNDELKKYCKRTEFIYLPPWKSIINTILAFLHKTPFQVEYYKSKTMENILNKIINEENPDIIHTNLLRMAPYTFNLSHSKKVIDLTDAVSLYIERFQKLTKNLFLKIFLHLEKKRITDYEKVINKYKIAFVCSNIDREYLQNRIKNSRIELNYNGIDLEQFTKIETTKRKKSIIFTGNMSYFPNIDASIYFVDEIFPIILNKIPDAHFYIVGQNPSRKLLRLESKNITVTGFVKNICEEYLKSNVAVSPVRYGAGTLNKILEPLSLGIPVVATTVGSLGLDLFNNEEIIITSSAQEFADSVIKLLESKNECERIGRNAEVKVRSKFGWDKISKELSNVYKAL